MLDLEAIKRQCESTISDADFGAWCRDYHIPALIAEDEQLRLELARSKKESAQLEFCGRTFGADGSCRDCPSYGQCLDEYEKFFREGA
jgi:hypothetical protein